MIYTTAAGDMWDSIAKKTLGNEHYMNLLMEENKEYADIIVFSAGIKLNIPDLAEENTIESIPPWLKKLFLF